jgi:MFS family permease
MVLTSFGQGVVASAILLGDIVGVAVISHLFDRYGRRKMVLTVALIFTAVSLSSACAGNVVTLMLARIFLETAVGGAYALVSLYLAEMYPVKSRGMLSTLNQLMVTFGILSAYLVVVCPLKVLRTDGA